MSETVGAKPPSRRWRWLLGVSLALNLMFIGLVAGAVLRGGGPHGGGKHAAELRGFGAPYLRELPRAERRALFRALRTGGHLPDRAARRAAYDTMVTALRTQPFEPTQAETILRQYAGALGRAQEAAQAEWLRQVSQMSEADRAAYADRLEERMQRRPRKDR
ncbi:periplasmic heavy metal sensor [uncultured Sulfitobacter sp.]|uniref:periplasmic heavy metal sensor n=1 Tax=uncultured Sulfitobacter sp. TaxID=191468 RepID=UPI002637056E|nr:periplasmic heavy metal sensor [uncultured Sulfitobacter sp.]